MKTLLIFITFFYSVSSFGNGDCDHDRTTFRCVTYVKNYDADTITFNIGNIHPLLGDSISIRVAGVDTPEIRTKDPCEKRVANQAKEFVANLLQNAKRIDLTNIKRGKYFRIVADVELDGVQLSPLLLQHRYAYPYDGGTKLKIDWCQN